MQDIPLFVADGADTPREGLPFIERQAITAIVYNPKTKKYLGLRWKEVNWETFVTGGVEDNQTPEEAARAEVHEETGYKNLKLIRELPRYDAQFFHHPKGVNRFAHFSSFYFELLNDTQDVISGDEISKHEVVWLTRAEIEKFALPEGHRFIFESIS